MLNNPGWWAVHEDYRIEHGALVASGAHRLYDPLAHPELVGAFAKLHDGDDKGLIGFAHTWGLLMGELSDQAWRVWTHASQIRLVLDLHQYLQTPDLEGLSSFLRSQLPMIDRRAPGGDDQERESALTDLQEFISDLDYEDINDPIQYAQTWVADRVNSQLRYSHDWLDYDPDTQLARLIPRCPDLLTAIYRHLARVVAGKRQIARCDECGSLFVVTDRRQKYCPPPPEWGTTGSLCGDRHRKRVKRQQKED